MNTLTLCEIHGKFVKTSKDLKLKERVGWGEEFLIYHNDIGYWISRNNKGVYFTRNKDSFTQEFIDSEELFDKALIEQRYIKDLYKEIEW